MKMVLVSNPWREAIEVCPNITVISMSLCFQSLEGGYWRKNQNEMIFTGTVSNPWREAIEVLKWDKKGMKTTGFQSLEGGYWRFWNRNQIWLRGRFQSLEGGYWRYPGNKSLIQGDGFQSLEGGYWSVTVRKEYFTLWVSNPWREAIEEEILDLVWKFVFSFQSLEGGYWRKEETVECDIILSFQSLEGGYWRVE